MMKMTRHLDDEHMQLYEWSGAGTGMAVGLPLRSKRTHPWHGAHKKGREQAPGLFRSNRRSELVAVHQLPVHLAMLDGHAAIAVRRGHWVCSGHGHLRHVAQAE